MLKLQKKLKLIIIKGYRVLATMIYGQTFLLQCSALRRFLVTDGQNTYDQIKRGRRSKCA